VKIGASMDSALLEFYTGYKSGAITGTPKLPKNNMTRIYGSSRHTPPSWTDPRLLYCKAAGVIPFISTETIYRDANDNVVASNKSWQDELINHLLATPSWVSLVYVSTNPEPEYQIADGTYTEAQYRTDTTEMWTRIQALPGSIRAKVKYGPVFSRQYAEKASQGNFDYSLYDTGVGDFFGVDMFMDSNAPGTTNAATAYTNPTTFLQYVKAYKHTSIDTRERVFPEFGATGLPFDTTGSARAAWMEAIHNQLKTWAVGQPGWTQPWSFGGWVWLNDRAYGGSTFTGMGVTRWMNLDRRHNGKTVTYTGDDGLSVTDPTGGYDLLIPPLPLQKFNALALADGITNVPNTDPPVVPVDPGDPDPEPDVGDPGGSGGEGSQPEDGADPDDDQPELPVFDGTRNAVIAYAEPNNNPPRVRVEGYWLDKTKTVKLTRLDPSGEVSPVRGTETAQPVGSDNHFTFFDYESPFGVDIKYKADDNTDGGTATSQTARLNVRSSAWLRHPGNPPLSIKVEIEDDESPTRKVNRAVHEPIGRLRPIVVTDGTRKAKSATMKLRTYTLAEKEKILAIFQDAATLLVDVPPSWGWGIEHQYCAFGDLVESRPTNKAWLPYRDWTVSYDVVDRPVTGSAGIRTWVNVVSEAATWKDVPVLYAKWLDVVNGVKKIATGPIEDDPEIPDPDPDPEDPPVDPPPVDPPPATGPLSAGADTTIAAGASFSRTATEPTGTVTARTWKILSGPLGKDTTIGTAKALVWKPGDSFPAAATTTDIRSPVCVEMCYQIVSTAENGTLDWTTAYRYIEDIGDDRGYTGGLVGFVTSSGDMLSMVKQYVVEKPTNNLLKPYLGGLQSCVNVGYGSGQSSAAASNLGSAYLTAWRSCADNDPIFRKVQRDFRKSMYFDDALKQALADGVGPLGLCLHYDILVNHGVGNDSESYGGIIAAARASSSKPPSAGGTESAYLLKLCDLRDAVLQGWGDYQSDGRSTIFRKLRTDGKFTLLAPFSWSVYGDSYTMSARPAVKNDGTLGTYTLRYTATGLSPATDDVNVTVT
jgi:chitosanase